MIQTIIGSALTTLVGIVIGYMINKLKTLKTRDDTQNEALKIMLQNNLTNTFYAYEKFGEIPDYVYQSWLNELKVYEILGGDSYIHELAKRLTTFKIIHTNILTNYENDVTMAS